MNGLLNILHLQWIIYNCLKEVLISEIIVIYVTAVLDGNQVRIFVLFVLPRRLMEECIRFSF